LIQNLDPALSRRFHYKLQIPIPELPERIKLWEIHLPKSIPGSEALDIQSLAEHFCFTASDQYRGLECLSPCCITPGSKNSAFC
jgi:SpoVK/Ycf46/Vps4 family AAA+-type ATPase